MLSKFSEKYKFYLLVSLLLLTLIICYNLAFKRSITVIKQSRELKIKASIAVGIQGKTAAMGRQLKELNTRYFNESKDHLNTHELILEEISNLSNTYSVKLVEFPSKQAYQKASVEVETHTALLSGRFNNLLQMLHDLELNKQTGRIVSVGFYAEEDRKTKNRNLYTRFYIQNYRNISYNEN